MHVLGKGINQITGIAIIWSTLNPGCLIFILAQGHCSMYRESFRALVKSECSPQQNNKYLTVLTPDKFTLWQMDEYIMKPQVAFQYQCKRQYSQLRSLCLVTYVRTLWNKNQIWNQDPKTCMKKGSNHVIVDISQVRCWIKQWHVIAVYCLHKL